MRFCTSSFILWKRFWLNCSETESSLSLIAIFKLSITYSKAIVSLFSGTFLHVGDYFPFDEYVIEWDADCESCSWLFSTAISACQYQFSSCLYFEFISQRSVISAYIWIICYFKFAICCRYFDWVFAYSSYSIVRS